MIIALPKEVKENEYRVAATPSAVAALVRKGNTVLFEHNCGAGSGFSDEDYIAAGGQLTEHEALYRNSDMIYKVKEIDASEYGQCRQYANAFTLPSGGSRRSFICRQAGHFTYPSFVTSLPSFASIRNAFPSISSKRVNYSTIFQDRESLI